MDNTNKQRIRPTHTFNYQLLKEKKTNLGPFHFGCFCCNFPPFLATNILLLFLQNLQKLIAAVILVVEENTHLYSKSSCGYYQCPSPTKFTCNLIKPGEKIRGEICCGKMKERERKERGKDSFPFNTVLAKISHPVNSRQIRKRVMGFGGIFD